MHNLNIYPFWGRLLEIYFKPAVPAAVDLFPSPFSPAGFTYYPFLCLTVSSASPKTGVGGWKRIGSLKALLMHKNYCKKVREDVV